MYKAIIFLFFVSLMRGEDYYDILGIDRSASQNEIRKAFKKLAIIRHPDKNRDDPNAHDKFIQLTTAYQTLKKPDSRRKYDLSEKDGLNASNREQSYHFWNYNQYDFDMFGDNQYVITLDINDYFKSVANSESNWFLNFYSPICSHCYHLAPIWKKTAELLDGVVKIAAVNCENQHQLCNHLRIDAYPTLLYFNKNSQYVMSFTREITQDIIVQFALDRLNIHIPEISESQWKLFLHDKIMVIDKPILIFIDDQQNYFSFNEKRIVAATLDKIIDVKVFVCKDSNCHKKVSYDTHAVYLPTHNAISWNPIFFDNISDVNTLIEKVLEQLPSPQDLTDNDFENIRRTESDVAWLICFYLGDSKAVDTQIKKLLGLNINLGKMNCGRNGRLCDNLGVNRFPMWGILKPSGAFELNHGKGTNNDIIKFTRASAKAINVWALSAEKTLSILQRDNGHEVWFLHWHAPWCPPCIQFLSELRKASLKFDASVVRFGTIDCTVHAKLCHQYNINSYPVAMLINGSHTYQFAMQQTAANIIQFINEKKDPSVIELTSENFYRKLAKKRSQVIWVVCYFAPWCVSCQKLAPEWIAVAKSLRDLPFVNIASVDCEAESSLCASQAVRSYPKIRMYSLGSEDFNTVVLYNGQQNSLSILTWITTFFPKKIHDLNFSGYQEALNSKHIWIIDFYVPQCGPCQRMEPEFAIAAQLLEKVRFGRINCNFYMNDCVQANIKVFPTLMLYKPKEKRKHSDHVIRITAITAKEIKDKISKIINTRITHDEL